MPTCFIVVDTDAVVANSLSRSLSKYGYSFPVASLEEVGGDWPKECSIFVSDNNGQLDEVIDFIRNRGIFYPIIPFNAKPSPLRVVETIRHGVMSYLDWPCSPERLSAVLESIQDTNDILFKRQSERVRALSLLKTLTPREVDVLETISLGATSKEVATRLGISLKTVEVHRNNIFSKLKVRNVIQAVRLAFEVNIHDASLRSSSNWRGGRVGEKQQYGH